MQDVDRPRHIQSLPEPTGARCARVDAKALRVVTSTESLDGITEHRDRRRHHRQRATVRPSEPERPIGPARDLEALLVDGSMMPATEQREV